MRTPLPDLILYGRDGCHLCTETRALLDDLFSERRASGLPIPRLVERDITSDPAWERAFRETIPVVELGDRRLELATSRLRLRAMLRDVLDRNHVEARDIGAS